MPEECSLSSPSNDIRHIYITTYTSSVSNELHLPPEILQLWTDYNHDDQCTESQDTQLTP